MKKLPTKNEYEIMELINRHYFMEFELLALFLDKSENAIRLTIGRMKQKKLLKLDYGFMKHKIIFLSKYGHSLLDTTLYHKDRTKLNEYDHDKNVMLIINHFRMLGVAYATEREFRNVFGANYFKGSQKNKIPLQSAVPDFLLFYRGKFICVELEWTRKKHIDIKNKMIEYLTNPLFNDVIYFCRGTISAANKKIKEEIAMTDNSIFNKIKIESHKTYQNFDLNIMRFNNGN